MAFKMNLKPVKDYSKQINDIKIPDISTTLNIRPIKKFNLNGVKSLKNLGQDVVDLSNFDREISQDLSTAKEDINDNRNGVWQNSINNENIKNNLDNIEEILQETREDAVTNTMDTDSNKDSITDLYDLGREIIEELQEANADIKQTKEELQTAQKDIGTNKAEIETNEKNIAGLRGDTQEAITELSMWANQLGEELGEVVDTTATQITHVLQGVSKIDEKVTTLEGVNNRNTKKVEGLIHQLVGDQELGNNDNTDTSFSADSFYSIETQVQGPTLGGLLQGNNTCSLEDNPLG